MSDTSKKIAEYIENDQIKIDFTKPSAQRKRKNVFLPLNKYAEMIERSGVPVNVYIDKISIQ